jgi:hypothetical protein
VNLKIDKEKNGVFFLAQIQFIKFLR